MNQLEHKSKTALLTPTAIVLFLIATVLLSPVLYTVFGASSGAAGVFAVATMYCLILTLHNATAPLKCSITAALIVLGLLLVIVTQGVTSFFMNQEFDFTRFGKSILLLFITILGALSVAYLSRTLESKHIDLALRIVFFGLLLCGTLGALSFSPLSTDVFWKAVFFFPEPSHYALCILPFLLYTCVISKPLTKLCALCSGLLIGVFLQSLTLLVGVILVAVVTLPKKPLLLVTTCIVAAFSAIDPESLPSAIDPDYFLARLDPSEENHHLSVMAFKQGWEMAYLDLEQSFGLGVGFQQFGIVGDDIGTLQDIAKLNEGAELNRYDGGTVASKFIGEFGIVGASVLLVYLMRFASIARFLRSVATGRIAYLNTAGIFFLSCFTTFFIDLFVRGTGYFSPSSFLFASSIAWMAIDRDHRTRNSSIVIPS
jgi:hypothetical protein